jgi:quercetin dioxygenase-like cupin family protein
MRTAMKLQVTRQCFRDEREAIQEISDAGWRHVSWHDEPGDAYPPHTHDVDQFLYVVAGSLELEVEGQTIVLDPGDRLALPARTVHAARTHASGATYLIATPGAD